MPSASLSEDSILACISRYFPQDHPSLLLGRGDDAALLGNGSPLCVSSDLFLEDIHFRRSYFTPEETGHKALAVNISDLAACGAKPLGFTLCLGLPPEITMPWLEDFFNGMAALAGAQGMALAGGDLSRCERLHISITAWGEGGFLSRGASLPGDCLFVVGDIGLARVGLRMLEAHGREALGDWPRACAAHLRPKPRTDAGLALALAGHNARPPSLMDVSDGIVRDLPRLLGQGGALGTDVTLPDEMLHPEVLRYAARYHKNPAQEALLGGEDYALLGTCAPDMLQALEAGIPEFMRIGTVNEGGSFTCNGEPLDRLRGFDHFET
ncbi:MAG: thiamine-phosphate kinase [Desulfovibrio sp.]|jgi:thiamine-monophosphate kinase|nr:thiamine-phosphate kinase [Desulfovibrio sp.]